MQKAIMGSFIVILLALGALVVMSNATHTGEFKIVDCFIDNEGDVASLTFRDARNKRRHVSFSVSAKFSLIETERSKAAIEWDQIVAVHIRRSRNNGEFALLAIELTEATGFRPPLVEFGLIDLPCSGRIRQRYEPYLKFVQAPRTD